MMVPDRISRLKRMPLPTDKTLLKKTSPRFLGMRCENASNANDVARFCGRDAAAGMRRRAVGQFALCYGFVFAA